MPAMTIDATITYIVRKLLRQCCDIVCRVTPSLRRQTASRFELEQQISRFLVKIASFAPKSKKVIALLWASRLAHHLLPISYIDRCIACMCTLYSDTSVSSSLTSVVLSQEYAIKYRLRYIPVNASRQVDIDADCLQATPQG